MFNMSATYSPEDNKLRLYPVTRLDTETYARVKAAGFKWAPKQELFVAPMWTPQRENLLIDLCGEIGDEDTTLVDRAERRAERFEDYSDRRAADSQSATARVKSIADGIPFGQPILVGHHSERRARKDAQKIENGMRKAVLMWQQSEYWTSRAAGAIQAAKYKERPDVRARRIKTIEADKRKQERTRKEAEKFLKAYTDPEARGVKLKDGRELLPALLISWEGGLSHENTCRLEKGELDFETALGMATASQRHTVEWCNRWISHYDNRLAYERAMLNEAGGTAADKYEFEVGGRVRHKWGWSIIKKVNKKCGVTCSVSLVSNQYPTVVQVEDIKEYKAPSAEDTAKTKAATAKAPICNYQGEISFVNRYHGNNMPAEHTIDMTKAEWDRMHKDYKGTCDVAATETAAKHRVRFCCRGGHFVPVFLSDEKTKLPAKPEAAAEAELPAIPRTAPAHREHAIKETPDHITAMKETLKAGIQTVSAPQLFPTPPDIAAYMVDLLDPQPGERIGEFSAGTGNLIKATLAACPDCSITAVEIAPALVTSLQTRFPQVTVHQADFLQCNGDLGKFDKIILNPPFENAVDIKHIRHAQTFLNPGGKLVSLCANGPRQQEAFKSVTDHWEVLPEGSFREQGTGVNVALVVFGA